jgi:hypothetical protein
MFGSCRLENPSHQIDARFSGGDNLQGGAGHFVSETGGVPTQMALLIAPIEANLRFGRQTLHLQQASLLSIRNAPSRFHRFHLPVGMKMPMPVQGVDRWLQLAIYICGRHYVHDNQLGAMDYHATRNQRIRQVITQYASDSVLMNLLTSAILTSPHLHPLEQQNAHRVSLSLL